MNILVLNPYSAQNPHDSCYIYSPAKEYQKQGHSVRVIAFSPFGKSSPGWKGTYTFATEHQTVDGVDFYRVRFLSLSKFGARMGLNRHNELRALKRHFSLLLRDFRPDVIHAHTLGTSHLACWLKEQFGCPIVITTHGTDCIAPFSAGQYGVIQSAVSAADAVVAVSSSLRDMLVTATHREDISLILNGAQLRFAVSDTPKRPLTFLQVGDLISRKKADVTIRAFAKLRQTYPEAVLTLVGRGPEEAHFKELCASLNISDAVRFTGLLPNLQVLEEMSRTQFFIMPSVREGFGIVYLEAMACGCVTIGTEGEGIADLIVSGQNGLLVPPDDPEAIVSAVETCLRDPDHTAALTAQGRIDAQSLTWEKNASDYLALFGSLTNETSRS